MTHSGFVCRFHEAIDTNEMEGILYASILLNLSSIFPTFTFINV